MNQFISFRNDGRSLKHYLKATEAPNGKMPTTSLVTFTIHQDYPPGSFIGDLTTVAGAKVLLNSSSKLSQAELSGGSLASFLTLHRATGTLTLSRWLPCDLNGIVHDNAADEYHIFRLRLGLASMHHQAIEFAISVLGSSNTAALGCLAFKRPLYQFSATASATRSDYYCFGRVRVYFFSSI